MARTSFPLSATEVLLINSLSALGDTGVNQALKKSGNSIVNTNITGSLSYQGTWNATTNSPAITSGVGTLGYYYYVSVAGTTNIDGINDWQIGDMLLFNGTVWQKVDNTDAVTSVAGKTGAVTLSLDDLTDVAITGVGTGDFLRYNGTNFVNTAIGASDIPSGIDATKIGNGDVTNTELSYIASATGTTGTGNLVFSASPTFTGSAVFDRIDANTLHAVGSGGLLIEANSGTDVALFGAGGSSGATFYGGVNVAGSLLFTSSVVNVVATNSSDGSDDKAITIAGGGAYGPTRGSGIAVIGNEYATIGGDLELMAGDSAVSGMIKFYVGDGAGNALLAGSIARTSMLATFNGSVVANSTLSVASTLTVGGQATATSVGMEIGNTAGGTPFIDFKSSAVDYNVRIINGTSTTLSFMGATGGYFFDTTVNSIYAKVATTANATLTTITQGLTIAGNLVTSAYVADGYTAGLTWSSTDDNASKPKAGVFCRTTGSGSYIFFGTSNAYVTGIVNTVSIGPDGDIAANRYSATSTATTQNVIFAQSDSLTTGKLGYFYSNSGDTNSRSLVSIVNDSSAATGTTALTIQQDANAGAMTITSANTTTTAFQITVSSLTSGRGGYIYSNSSSSSQFVLLDLTNANASATGMIPLAMANAAPTSTNYFRMMYLGGNSGGNFIWKSNGVTPNGNLSGSVGDICIGADSGKAYYCTGTTNWTAM